MAQLTKYEFIQENNKQVHAGIESQELRGKGDDFLVKIQVPDEYRPGMMVRFTHPERQDIVLQCALPNDVIPGTVIQVKVKCE